MMMGPGRKLNTPDADKVSLDQSKHLCETQMKALDDLIAEHKEVLVQLKKLEQTMRENRVEANELRKDRDIYKKRYLLCCEENRKIQIRENAAYAKVQDAVQMVEAAINERNAAIQREREIQDECDRLAVQISRVMEEAGEKVGGNLEEIKMTYSIKIQKLEDVVKKLIITKETSANSILEMKNRMQEMQKNLAKSIETNKLLNSDLQTASKTIVELEMKLNAYDKMIYCGQATSKETEERSMQLRNLLEDHIKLKQRWKDTCSDITERLQNEMVHVQAENTKLIAENRKLNKDLKRRDMKKKPTE